MGLSIDPDALTVSGYRDAINAVLEKNPHASEITRLSALYPKLRPVMIRVAYILGQGEGMRWACTYADTTPLLFKEMWLQIPEFRELMTDTAPEHTGSAEGFKLAKKEEHHMILAEIVKRSLHDIEAAKNAVNDQYDPMLESGLLLVREKTVGKTVSREYYSNPSFRTLERALQMCGELESLYRPKIEDMPDDTVGKGITKMSIGRVAPAADQAARDAAKSN